MTEIESEPVRPRITDAKGILQQNREFLDFFWDIAKPEQEIRLEAIRSIVKYLKNSQKPDELKYTLKRLVEGLAHSRETARPAFSLALGQVLSSFEDISMCTIFDDIKEKHNLQSVAKKRMRNALFGNYFGVLALSQSSRLTKEPQVLLGCIQLLQTLSNHREHLKDLPSQTMVDILSETPQEVFEELLVGALQGTLSSAFTAPEHLQLLLVAIQRFPGVLKPEKLKSLLGTATIVTTQNIPKLTEVLRMVARSLKKDNTIPGVALDLLKVSIREGTFDLFWNKAVISGLLRTSKDPTHFLSFHLLGSALPLLSLSQLHEVLSGEVMKQYGMHVVSVQLPKRLKLGPVMERYVDTFLEGCESVDKQLAVMQGFTLLTNHGYPVVPSNWPVVRHLSPTALQRYMDWLKQMFLNPEMEKCVYFSTRRQDKNQEGWESMEDNCVRLRNWIVPRLTSLMENHQVKRKENQVMDIARFVFFHAFFNTKKATPNIVETEAQLSVPLEEKNRTVLANSFYGLLKHMHNMPVLRDTAEDLDPKQRRVMGVTEDGTLWISHMVQFANSLLNQPQFVTCIKPFAAEQREAWNSILSSAASKTKKSKKQSTAETNAFQHLFLVIGIHLFMDPEALRGVVLDVQDCLKRAQARGSKKKKQATEEEEEPHWVEVMMEILLYLLSQESSFMRKICKTVFASICPFVTATALTSLLSMLDPDEVDDAFHVASDQEDQDEETSDGEEEDSDASDSDSENEDPKEVDQNLRLELMKVLQGQNALATEDDGSELEDLDDETMMKLDSSLAPLFSEHKKKMEAKKNMKDKLRKQKIQKRNFKIKVLELLEVFLNKQGTSSLVIGMLEPLLMVIERGMSSDTDEQEQNFLRKAADILSNGLCRGKMYCRDVGDRHGELHDLLEKLMHKAQKQPDSSIAQYFFSACLYLVKVLRGACSQENRTNMTENGTGDTEVHTFMGKVDVERVTAIFKDALHSFMTKRNSPLTALMFIDLFTKFPVLCSNLLDVAVENITAGVRDHQQGQACILVLRGIQSREVQEILKGSPRAQLCQKIVSQLKTSVESATRNASRAVLDKMIKVFDLCTSLISHINQQKLDVDLEPLRAALQTFDQLLSTTGNGKLQNKYWAVMKHFGVVKPTTEKRKKPSKELDQQTAPKKKKGFLPESKKRNKRKKMAPGSDKSSDQGADASIDHRQEAGIEPPGKKKKKQKKLLNKNSGTPVCSATSATKPSMKKKRQDLIEEHSQTSSAISEDKPPRKRKQKDSGQATSHTSPAKKVNVMPASKKQKKKVGKSKGGAF